VSNEKTLTLAPFAEEHAETVPGENEVEPARGSLSHRPNEAADSAAAWNVPALRSYYGAGFERATANEEEDSIRASRTSTSGCEATHRRHNTSC
jgi:hypothetical protein